MVIAAADGRHLGSLSPQSIGLVNAVYDYPIDVVNIGG